MVNNHFPTALYYTIYKYTSCIDLAVSNLHEEKVKTVSLKRQELAGISVAGLTVALHSALLHRGYSQLIGGR